MRILVTGTAGFIGHHVACRMADEGHDVSGLDNLNQYYDISLKTARLAQQGFTGHFIDGKIHSSIDRNIRFIKMDLCDKEGILDLFKNEKFDYVIHLAAQAGVRYSLINPQIYIDSNITGFLNILEACRSYPVKHLIYASSSSVYGLDEKIPFTVKDNTSHPISLYAASKKANELMAHTYSHLFGMPVTGLRFFTVYGPWGRPDMALFIFTKAILEGKPFEVYNNGEMRRDFTYVDDITESINRLLLLPPQINRDVDKTNLSPDESSAPFKIFNIGNHQPVTLMEFILAIEKAANKKGIKIMKPLQPGDVVSTYADVQSLTDYIGFKPATNVQHGINAFVEWYKKYYMPNTNIVFSS